MSDLGSEHNMPPVLSVGELSQALKRAVEDKFGSVRVRGEISQPKVPGSGHCYLRLKDQDAVLDGVIWRGTLARLGLRPEDGMEVICTGRLTTYPGRSTYQIIVEQMELAGEGALLKMIEERRRRLAEEGLFAASRKRALPYLPEVIGVVTSPTGAVIRDILHRLADRFPRHVLLWPVKVQGPEAADQVAAAVAGFNKLGPGEVGGSAVPRPDVLIVARGGGSLEDLMAFNEEAVVRAVADSAIPVITAVGHETDTTTGRHGGGQAGTDADGGGGNGGAGAARPGGAGQRGRWAAGGRAGAAAAGLPARGGGGWRGGLPEPRRLLETAAQTVDDRAERLALAWAGGSTWRARGVGEQGRRLLTPRATAGAGTAEAGRGAAAVAAFAGRTRRRIGDLRGDVVALAGRGRAGAARRLDSAAQEVAAVSALLNSFSYERVLERGFSLCHRRRRQLGETGGRPAQQPRHYGDVPGTRLGAGGGEGQDQGQAAADQGRRAAGSGASATTGKGTCCEALCGGGLRWR